MGGRASVPWLSNPNLNPANPLGGLGNFFLSLRLNPDWLPLIPRVDTCHTQYEVKVTLGITSCRDLFYLNSSLKTPRYRDCQNYDLLEVRNTKITIWLPGLPSGGRHRSGVQSPQLRLLRVQAIPSGWNLLKSSSPFENLLNILINDGCPIMKLNFVLK